MYAILDVETTGGSAKQHKITEIAIYLHDGEQVTGSFTSLVNPEQRIPWNIVNLTGITDAMVSSAPKFYEIAKEIVELTEDRILVAHNAGFDYNFIKSEFKSLGYEYKRKRICTLQMSRRLLPGIASYRLGKLCERFGISLERAHRAAGDAAATVQLFEELQKLEERRDDALSVEDAPAQLNLFSSMHRQLIQKIPPVCGVYYFFDAEGQLIYVGKSVNIRSRVLSHFANNDTRKAIEMKQRIADIRFEETGSELVALLKESDEIRRHKPPYNRAQRRSVFNAGVFVDYDDEGYLRLRAERLRKDMEAQPLLTFGSAKAAQGFLYRMVEEHELCQKLCGLYKSSGPCFRHAIHKCLGACNHEETPHEYNARAESALENFRYDYENVLIVDRGRKEEEKALVCIAKGQYQGFGFVPAQALEADADELRQFIQAFPDNRNTRQIIRSYMRHKSVERVLVF